MPLASHHPSSLCITSTHEHRGRGLPERSHESAISGRGLPERSHESAISGRGLPERSNESAISLRGSGSGSGSGEWEWEWGVGVGRGEARHGVAWRGVESSHLLKSRAVRSRPRIGKEEAAPSPRDDCPSEMPSPEMPSPHDDCPSGRCVWASWLPCLPAQCPGG